MSSKTKKKSLLEKLSTKFGKNEPNDALLKEAVSELKDLVSGMKDMFDEFDDKYDEKLEQDRSILEKVQSKLPKFLQAPDVQNQERQRKKIESNKFALTKLEDSLSKIELATSGNNVDLLSMEEAYIDLLKQEQPGLSDEKAISTFEERLKRMEENFANSISDMSASISLIKSSLDNMAGQLEEQGVVLTNIDQKVDVLDTKLDKAQELIEKVSKQITGNRVIILITATAISAILLSRFVK